MSKHEELVKSLRASAATMPFDAAVAVQYRAAADALEAQAREIEELQAKIAAVIERLNWLATCSDSEMRDGDTARHLACELIELLEGPERLHKLLTEIQRQPDEGATKALAECRDIFPIPPEGHKLESGWLNAMGSPESVPDYLKACVEDLHTQIEDKELELKKLATAFQAQQVELARLKGCINGREP